MIHGIDRGQLSSATGRSLDLESWANAGVPLLGDPRDLVTELHQRHLPQPGTSVIAVLERDHRVVASASVTTRPHVTDGWHHRNALLGQLRKVTPHDLRLPCPRRTAVLLHCRDGEPGWSEPDGAWMWALRDAASLHGLRCGAYVALTPDGWHVFGEGRHGRTPHSASWAERPVRTVSELTRHRSVVGRVHRLDREPAPARIWTAAEARTEAARRAAN
ncbi:hypothetical protein [Kitasatospora viridis]|uniref:Uncharacterized protein n=1 Tax=Kitasatospora viridis TaxID=281105 RepID=A0A561UE39_9ACTN|nr:hypothetical protein [Kitasatospora viridis]TWF97598.1 hypothetical protein FHX73_111384 [Kitasatospora viridis]